MKALPLEKRRWAFQPSSAGLTWLRAARSFPSLAAPPLALQIEMCLGTLKLSRMISPFFHHLPAKFIGSQNWSSRSLLAGKRLSKIVEGSKLKIHSVEPPCCLTVQPSEMKASLRSNRLAAQEESRELGRKVPSPVEMTCLLVDGFRY